MSTTPATTEQEFAGRTALVTGGASGIGLALAHRLAAAGASVVVADYDEESARKAVAALESTGAKARPSPWTSQSPPPSRRACGSPSTPSEPCTSR